MTWFPLQAALKMPTLLGAIRAALDALLDHINPAKDDPTRPDTLIVWESRERLAAETSFSEVTTRDHLQRLRGEKDLRKGQRVMVLQRIEDAGSHRAARYELLPAALDTLADPARLLAFEEHPPREGHPYYRWRQWRAAQMAPAEVGESAFPQLGQASSPELPQVDLDKEELTTAPTTIMQSAGKAKDRSPATAPPLPEWRTTDGIYGEHRRCGTCHRRDQPCPWFAWEERAAGVGTG